MGYAFISYSTKNQKEADAMRDLFRKNGIDTWMAPYDIPVGSRYAQVVNQALKGCACLVLLLTDEAQNSTWVSKEVERAVSYRRTIVPLQLETIKLNDEFELYISTDQIMAIPKIDEDRPEVQKMLQAVSVYTGTEGPAPYTQAPAAPTPNQGYYSSAPQQYPQSGAASPYQGMGGAAPNGMFYFAPMQGMYGTMPNQSAMWGMPPAASNEMRLKAATQHPVLTERARLVKELADEGYVPAISTIGLYYEYGNGVPQNMTEAVSMYRTAAAFGDVDAHRYLADCYKDGKGVEKNLEMYKTYLLKAAELGSGTAQNELGSNYADGKNGFPKIKEEAIRWYERAVQQGHPGATLGLNMVKLGI